jgi:hypothetical protein
MHHYFAFYLRLRCAQAEKKARIRDNKLEQGAAKVAEELQKCKFFHKAY